MPLRLVSTLSTSMCSSSPPYLLHYVFLWWRCLDVTMDTSTIRIMSAKISAPMVSPWTHPPSPIMLAKMSVPRSIHKDTNPNKCTTTQFEMVTVVSALLISGQSARSIFHRTGGRGQHHHHRIGCSRPACWRNRRMRVEPCTVLASRVGVAEAKDDLA
jgi:hypothetical protein